MVTITQQDGMLHVSGRTYEHREKIKSECCGRWDPKNKVWVVENTDINKQILKRLKMRRNCGWCGVSGHVRTKCDDYKDYRIKEEVLKYQQMKAPRYQRFSDRKSCKCGIKTIRNVELGIDLEYRQTCWMCENYCCSKAVECESNPRLLGDDMNYICDIHGNYQMKIHMEFMNDSSGT